MRSRTFLDLPLELLDEGVLRRLDYRDVLRCSAVRQIICLVSIIIV